MLLSALSGQGCQSNEQFIGNHLKEAPENYPQFTSAHGLVDPPVQH
jgi:hypothetical protein